MHMPSPVQLLIILAIILLIFGGKRVAELAKGLGAGVKNFKNAVKDDENAEDVEVAKEEEAKVIEKPKAKRAVSTKTATAKTKAKTTSKPRAAKTTKKA